MTRTFIDSESIATAFNEACADLKDGTGAKAYKLTVILDAIASVTGDPVLYPLPQAIGNLTWNVIQHKKLVSVPIFLSKEMREQQTTIVKDCINNAVEQIKKIGQEIGKQPPDTNALIHAVGIIYKQISILAQERSAIAPSKGMPHVSEEE